LVLAGGPGEESQLEPVALALADVPHRVVCFARLRSFLAFLAGSDLFLGNDNGPRHIAIALGVPTVAYFGAHNPTHWTPPDTQDHPVIWNPEHARGKTARSDIRLLSTDPDDVADEAARLLSGRENPPR